jgi:hypothetical protein
MKTVLDGIRYDTNKAEIVGSYNIGPGSNDFRTRKRLCMTSNGCFFLAGERGAMTEFPHTCSDNSRTAGSRIVPISAEEPLRWAEQYLETSTVVGKANLTLTS